MPLPVPSLDTRTFDDLLAEGRSLIPQEAPDWTDHNLHDPGITLIELLAWLSEQLLFRSDRVAPGTLRGFLRRVGVTPHPSTAATTVVALRRPPGEAQKVSFSAGLHVYDASRDIAFATLADLTVSRAWLELGADERPAGGGVPRGIVVAAGELVDQTAGRSFRPFGAAPRLGSDLRLGFAEPPAGPRELVRLHVWAPGWARDDRDELKSAASHYRAATTWEYLAGPDKWRPLELVVDDTRALTRSGAVVLRGPAAHLADAGSGHHWIRCRLAAGGYDCPPELTAVAINAVRVVHAISAGPEVVGRSRGAAAQAMELAGRPVVPGSTRLRLTRPNGTVDDAWREVAEWDTTGPDDRHYRVEADAGTLRFGDGRTGRVPPAGTMVTAAGYAVGGGSAGNVPARRLVRVARPGIAVVQRFPATGGAPSEPLERAHGRALQTLEQRTRGVTVADLETLTLDTPGVPVRRAHALPGHHPRFGCLPAAGVVTVVVLPGCGDPPQPSAAFLRAVRRQLERGRLLATELHVVGPTYVTVTVSATLHVASEARTRAAAEAAAALERLLDPLRGGEDGGGWSFGRDVLESEVMAWLQAVDGVRYVDGVGISAGKDGQPGCGSVRLCADQLPESGQHRIAVEEAP